MKVLLTGATGFLGSHLAELLVQQGHAVRAVVRKTSDTRLLETLGVERCLASFESGSGLADAVRGIDAVVHSAGLVKARAPEEFHEVNVRGTERLLDAVLEHAPDVKRFVLVSSLAAHGFPDDGRPRPWDAEPRPVTHYGRSKLAAEEVVLKARHQIPVTVIRPPAIYGPRDVEMFAFFQIIGRRIVPFMGRPDSLLSLIYAPDCARALYAAITKDHPSGRVYFVEDGRTYTQREFGQHVQRALGVRALELRVPLAVVALAAMGSELVGRVRNRAVMLTRDKINELKQPYLNCAGPEIRAELGWEPEVQLAQGAKLTADWYRANGWL